MNRFYLDTSALAKLYVQESGSDAMVQWAGEPGNTLTVLSIARVELYSALRRRLRDGSLTPGDFLDIQDEFDAHWNGFFAIQPIGDSLLSVAVDLLERRPLRAYDALQLAGCLLTVKETVFVCSDRELLRAAQEEGRQVFDPTA